MNKKVAAIERYRIVEKSTELNQFIYFKDVLILSLKWMSENMLHWGGGYALFFQKQEIKAMNFFKINKNEI